MAWILYIAVYIQLGCKDHDHCVAVLPPLAGIDTYIEAMFCDLITPQDYDALTRFIDTVTGNKYSAFDKDLETLKNASPLMYECFSAISKYEYEEFLHLKTGEARQILVEIPDIKEFSQIKKVFETRVSNLTPDASTEFKTNFNEIFTLLKDVDSKKGKRKSMAGMKKKDFVQMFGEKI